MIQSQSAGHAKAYFNDALLKSDYYLNDQELQGRFQGRIAQRLGLNEQATKEAFYDLCENINPVTGGHLTQRTVEQRTVGYDINFHCPKSVSVLHALSKDDHILNAFQKSVQETMQDVEADSKTRIRKKGQYDDRETGELAWAEFIHQTARPVDGSMPDPHLHAHCFAFNVTWDAKEKQFKAGQFRDIKRDMPYYEARFHKRLADHLTGLGYQVRKTDKFFEIEGVPQKAIDLFSKRTDEIGRMAKEKGITDAKELDSLGARTRSKKQKGHTMAELKNEWIRQIKGAGLDEKEGNAAIRHGKGREIDGLTPDHCVDHALLHRFERVSVIQDRRILETAYRHALGKSVSLDAITKSFKDDKRILHIKEPWRIVCTTKEVLAEEKHMVDLANQGKGKMKPLYLKEPTINLKGEQFEAVRHVLTTPHRVSIIRGRAGTGKTTLLKELSGLVEKAGKKITAVAPTAQAARGVLRDDGFKDAETVAKLMVDKQLQDQLEGQVLFVDEAGLLGTKDMNALLELATRKNARLILSGDTRQHSSVSRGDALRVLNTVGGIRSAEVSRIYRQKNKGYREAVQELSDGKVKEAFAKLDALESIKTINPLKPNETLVEDYLATIKKGKSALVISPTHKQGEQVTEDIRKRLRAAKLIGKKESKLDRLVNLNLTEAEKSDPRNYKAGDVIQFTQNMKGIKRGSAWTIKATKGNSLEIVNDEGTTANFSFTSKKFEVYKKSEIALSKGDRIRITRNGFDTDKKRLDNGQMFEILSAPKKGNIKLRNTISKSVYTLPRNYGHLAHAHCITSHASQGKTVDEVFIAQPASTFPATDLKQFYVSVSRGRDRVHVYTDDKEALLDHASQMGDRQSAIELLGKPKALSNSIAEHLSRESMKEQKTPQVKTKTLEKSEPITRNSHEREPEI
jgi:conjugative relaxase-like TrwC/TraI family protein